MANFGYIAILVYIITSVAIMLVPIKKIQAILKVELPITETHWKRFDIKLRYYRICVLVAGMITVVIMLLIYALINLFSS